MKKSLLLVLSTALVLSAAFVPVDRAKKVAENQYKQYCADESTKGANIINVVENRYEGEVTWYAIEFEKGFVIVSADDAVRPILGYSDHGKVPKADRKGGENFKEWFGYYDKQIALARKNNIVDKIGQQTWKNIENNVFSSSKAGILVDRLLRSEWDQGWPWNDSCYVVGGEQTPVGCIATAMAQISKFNRWPLTGTGNKRYRPYSGAANITEYFNSCHFDYDLMPDIPPIEYGLYPTYWESGITVEEVGMLAHHSWMLGFSAGMNYAADGSGATMANALLAMKTYWYHTGSASVLSMATPPAGGTDAQYATIKAQLDLKKPWQWAGGVHSFVLDGYRDDYWYHFNWGWGGSYDGWFHRSALIPDGTGTGGGDGDYTAGQQAFIVTPNTDVYAAWPATTVTGSIANGEDITVNWTAKTGATGYEVWRTFNKTAPELIATTTSLTYTDNDLGAGSYAYHVVVKYATGESHISNSYNNSVTAGFVYPIPRSVNATTVGRTRIDLTWATPFIGVMNEYVDFEGSTVFPTGWVAKISLATGGLLVDDMNYIRVYKPSNYTNWFYAYKAFGNLLVMSAALSTTHTLWFLSPTITFNSGHTIKWWNRFRYSSDGDYSALTAQRPRFQIVSYPSATFADQVYTQLALYDGFAGAPQNIWDYEESVSLASLNGVTTRVGIRIADNLNDLYTLAFDNITIGSSQGGGDNPNGYQIFRNGSLAATIGNGTTTSWSDTGFVDGENEYYMRATYPTGGPSITSNKDTAIMDANPKPGYLTGVGGNSAVLNWYAPYYNAPKWYSHVAPESCTSVIDGFPDDGTVCTRRRTIFKAADLGFFYPITLDSVAVGFYDMVDELNWGGQNTFTVRILTGGSYAIEDTIYTSGTLTAIHNKITTHALTTPLVLSEPWNVEITVNATTGYPSTLAALNPAGGHSYYYDTTYLSYSYGMWNGTDWYDWLHMSYVTSSPAPAIAKSSWISPSAELPVKGMLVDKTKLVKVPVTNPKAMDYYKIYRNGTSIGTSTSVTYEDTTVPVTGDYNYKVSAYYANPVGESLPTDEITLNVIAQTGPIVPAVPAPITTSIVTGNVKFDWPDAADATSYDVYSSATPYGTFALLTNVAISEYTYTPTATKMFFQFVSKNSTKESPRTIEIARPVAR
jgi:hypothetical protein